MTTSDRGVAFVGRLLMAVIFLIAGFGKLIGFKGTVGYFASLGIPLPEAAAVMSICIELGGGILLILGYRLLIVAPVMAVFTVVAGFFAHAFWNVADPALHMAQMNNFLKNIAMAGGFVMVMVDAWRRRRP